MGLRRVWARTLHKFMGWYMEPGRAYHMPDHPFLSWVVSQRLKHGEALMRKRGKSNE